ncbi:DMT family transporter [Gordonia sp. PDNC005]|uniref:DMT family transporter n=1 Tax=unclassified Gordonia (in: high G+C Gram-positive bacteria) TaxID=2657482 RepID=UPI00196368EE|nr:DMT family transporter [Gordonia sp. PDNC005]QRY62555.1 DMT family transporter [Gordonia sp. PDNC005]
MRLSIPLGASTAFFYALGYPIGAVAVRAATPGTVLVSRFLASVVILAAIVTARRLEWPRGVQAWHAVVVGFLSQGLQFVGCYQAMYAGVSPVLVALVIAMNPVITAGAAAIMLREPLSRRRVLATVLALVAVCVAFAGRVVDVGHVDAAVGWVVIAVIGLAVGGVYQQRYLTQGHPIAVNTIGVGVALVPASVFAAVTPQHVSDVHEAVWSIAVLVIANSVIAASLYLAAIKQAGAAAVSLLFGVIPSIAALLTWAILGERPDIGVVIGLVVGAIACFVGNERSRRPVSAGCDEHFVTTGGNLSVERDHQIRTRSSGSRYSLSPGATSKAE